MIFENYARYYDFLYQDKNYGQEADYIDQLIKKNSRNAKTILELGCGTGRHAELLCRKGYEICGVDISNNMVEQAQRRFASDNVLKEKATFVHGDMRSLQLNKKFDVVISLFHVVSYQTTNEDVQKAFAVAQNHLNSGGLFIFDCWYGPAILAHTPAVRIKRFENDDMSLTRITEPAMNANENYVDIHFNLYVQDKKNKEIGQVKESHRMRYFFKPEVEQFLHRNNFEIVQFEEWINGNVAGTESRDVCFVCRKK
jgi:SAM-dependent methyltransferase